MEGLHDLSEIDFFLTLGDNPALVDLNGLNFTIKLGVIERLGSVGSTGASSMSSRAVKRVRNS